MTGFILWAVMAFAPVAVVTNFASQAGCDACDCCGCCQSGTCVCKDCTCCCCVADCCEQGKGCGEDCDL